MRAPGAGVLLGDQVVALASADFRDMLSVLASGEAGAQDRELRHRTRQRIALPLSSVRLLAPVPRPPKLICIGLNYRDHAAETRQEIPNGSDHLREVFKHRDRPGRAHRACRRIRASRTTRPSSRS